MADKEKEVSDLVYAFLEERALTADDHAKQLMFHFGLYLIAKQSDNPIETAIQALIDEGLDVQIVIGEKE